MHMIFDVKIGNYIERRLVQKLAGPIDINKLVVEFVRKKVPAIWMRQRGMRVRKK